MGNEKTDYRKNSISLWGAVSLGTGVMIGAGILALTGQIAELAGTWFPAAFIIAALIAANSAYSYIKLSNAYPSAGGIAMFLEKAYGKGVVTAVAALMMYVSMVINESLVARTFGTYTLQLFGRDGADWLVPTLGIGLIAFAFVINLLSNKKIQVMSFVMAVVKTAGLAALAGGGLYAAGLSFSSFVPEASEQGAPSVGNFLASIAIGILAYKGFTTITNSGGEIKEPTKNVGRAIIISLVLCTALYLLVSWAVSANLTIEQIITHKDYVLAEAARPAFGNVGLWLTVGFAILATVSGIIASFFAVSRMLAMLTNMKLVPHKHFGMPGSIQKHTLVYTVVLAAILTAFFDLGSIATLGAIFYLMMDIVIHWGVFKHLRREIGAKSTILWSAIILDSVVLGGLLWVKIENDMTVIWTAFILIGLIIVGEKIFLSKGDDSAPDEASKPHSPAEAKASRQTHNQLKRP